MGCVDGKYKQNGKTTRAQNVLPASLAKRVFRNRDLLAASPAPTQKSLPRYPLRGTDPCVSMVTRSSKVRELAKRKASLRSSFTSPTLRARSATVVGPRAASHSRIFL